MAEVVKRLILIIMGVDCLEDLFLYLGRETGIVVRYILEYEIPDDFASGR